MATTFLGLPVPPPRPPLFPQRPDPRTGIVPPIPGPFEFLLHPAEITGPRTPGESMPGAYPVTPTPPAPPRRALNPPTRPPFRRAPVVDVDGYVRAAKRVCRDMASTASAAATELKFRLKRAAKKSTVAAIKSTILVAAVGHAGIYRPAYRVVQDVRRRQHESERRAHENHRRQRMRNLPPSQQEPTWQRGLAIMPNAGRDATPLRQFRQDQLEFWQLKRLLATDADLDPAAATELVLKGLAPPPPPSAPTPALPSPPPSPPHIPDHLLNSGGPYEMFGPDGEVLQADSARRAPRSSEPLTFGTLHRTADGRITRFKPKRKFSRAVCHPVTGRPVYENLDKALYNHIRETIPRPDGSKRAWAHLRRQQAKSARATDPEAAAESAEHSSMLAPAAAGPDSTSTPVGDTAFLSSTIDLSQSMGSTDSPSAQIQSELAAAIPTEEELDEAEYQEQLRQLQEIPPLGRTTPPVIPRPRGLTVPPQYAADYNLEVRSADLILLVPKERAPVAASTTASTASDGAGAKARIPGTVAGVRFPKFVGAPPGEHDAGADSDGGASNVSDSWQPQSGRKRSREVGDDGGDASRKALRYSQLVPISSEPTNYINPPTKSPQGSNPLCAPTENISLCTPPHVKRRKLISTPNTPKSQTPRSARARNTPRTPLTDATNLSSTYNSAPPDLTVLSSTYDSPVPLQHARTETLAVAGSDPVAMSNSDLVDHTVLSSTYDSPTRNIHTPAGASPDRGGDANGGSSTPANNTPAGPAPDRGDVGKADSTVRTDAPAGDAPDRGVVVNGDAPTPERLPTANPPGGADVVKNGPSTPPSLPPPPQTPAPKSVKFSEDTKLADLAATTTTPTTTMVEVYTPEAQFAQLRIRDEAEAHDATPKATPHSAEKSTRKTRAQQKKDEYLKELNQYPIEQLSAEWEQKVEQALKQGIKKGNDEYTVSDLARVVPPRSARDTDAWLNDEVINGYLKLVVAQGRKNDRPNQVPSYHAFTSFFYTNLLKSGHKAVARWALRAKIGGKNLLETERVFIPINHASHWTLCVVAGKERTIVCYDSLGGDGRAKADVVTDWVRAELGSHFVEDEWRVDSRGGTPRQQNSDDCGVFTITSARQIMLGKTPLSYGPEDIQVQRRRIVAELANGGLLKGK